MWYRNRVLEGHRTSLVPITDWYGLTLKYRRLTLITTAFLAYTSIQPCEQKRSPTVFFYQHRLGTAQKSGLLLAGIANSLGKLRPSSDSSGLTCLYAQRLT